eukprot:11165601-Lingulodinium_polyedra.AAC.1
MFGATALARGVRVRRPFRRGLSVEASGPFAARAGGSQSPRRFRHVFAPRVRQALDEPWAQ